jgi:hypothetical protein
MRCFWFLVFFTLLISCNDSNNKDAVLSENDTDAARNFIRAALDGRWDDAKKYMIPDSVNVQIIERASSRYQLQPKEERRSYRESTIRIFDSRQVNDSITIIHYSNTFKNARDSLKVVQQNGQWLIDLKYSLLPGNAYNNQ